MNYLAHLYFAHPTSESLIGNLMGDFVKGDPRGRFPERVVDGILLHRAIDAYTDRHPAFIASRQLISPERRRFAGIILDVCWDHFLSRHWLRYRDQPRADFIGDSYRLLAAYRGELPATMVRPLRLMIEQDWLGSYVELEGVGLALDRIARRFSRPTRLPGAVVELGEHYDALEARFLAFFPELQDHVAALSSACRERD